MQGVSQFSLAGHLFELYETRAGVYENSGRWSEAIADYGRSVEYAQELSYWRGLAQVSGSLALAYLQVGDFDDALAFVNKAIDADKQIPDELYFVPRNLAIKARILAKRGDLKASNDLYGRSMDLIDVLLSRVPTPGVERDLLSQLNQVYSGYFDSLCTQKRLGDVSP
jgi:tetratricopeptide (TPR) repeat protein